MENNLIREQQKISFILWGGGECEATWCCDKNPMWLKNCDDIEAYCEEGQMAPVVWFRVTKVSANGDRITVARVNSAHVREVRYAI